MPMTLRRSAFTLIEMLVVVSIIATLTGVGSWAYLRAVERAKYTQAIQAMNAWSTSLKHLGTELGLAKVGSLNPTWDTLRKYHGEEKSWKLDTRPVDPWGFVYESGYPDDPSLPGTMYSNSAGSYIPATGEVGANSTDASIPAKWAFWCRDPDDAKKVRRVFGKPVLVEGHYP